MLSDFKFAFATNAFKVLLTRCKRGELDQTAALEPELVQDIQVARGQMEDILPKALEIEKELREHLFRLEVLKNQATELQHTLDQRRCLCFPSSIYRRAAFALAPFRRG